jgi:hypothetical protein
MQCHPDRGVMSTRKILVGALLGTGVFIIVAALIRCVLSLLSISSTDVTAVWAAREMVRGAICARSRDRVGEI